MSKLIFAALALDVNAQGVLQRGNLFSRKWDAEKRVIQNAASNIVILSEGRSPKSKDPVMF